MCGNGVATPISGAPPLAGLPYSVKNLFDVEGVVTRAGSKINRDNPPAPRDAGLARVGVAAAAARSTM